MKAFVVGSRRLITDAVEGERFEHFCTLLGERLARKGWVVYAGSLDPTTADFWLLQGIDNVAAEGRSVDVHVYRSESIDENTFKNFKLTPHTEFPNMTVAHIAAISAADVVISIGGSKKTPGAIWAGIALHKPVVLLRQFHGSSADLWHDLHQHYADVLDKRNYNALLSHECDARELCENTVNACEKLVTTSKRKAFSSTEIVLYSVLGLTFGIIAFLLSATAGSLSWTRVIPVTILSVFTGWLFAPLIAREKKGLVSTVPHAMLLSLVILAFLALGGKMIEEIVDEAKANQQSTRLYFSLHAAGLVSGFGARATLLKWISKLSETFKGVPSIGPN